VLALCRKSGLTRLGHVAFDGTKIKASASKHKAMSYGRILAKEAELKREVAEWFARAEATDTQEDAEDARQRPTDVQHLATLEQHHIRGYVATGKQSHGKSPKRGRSRQRRTLEMHERLKRGGHRSR
jgi:sensor histidine kinase regulating citrate/malate metabolism